MEVTTTSKKGIWLNAIRLRTLPLSISGIIAGSALAYRLDALDLGIMIPALFTTLLLQILSNLANDYGDALKGSDGEHRIGPKRMVQSGFLSKKEIRFAIVFTAILAFCSGLILIFNAFGSEYIMNALVFLGLGIFAIWAAIKYTVGNSAYGYYGFGDVFVFLFFGLISVSGSFFLFTKYLTVSALLESISIGVFSTGVLHLNNMRDRESDSISGKQTIAVRLGEKKSVLYFHFLMIWGITASLFDVLLTALHITELLQLLIVIPVGILMYRVSAVRLIKDYNNYLKPLALVTVLYSMLLFLGYII